MSRIILCPHCGRALRLSDRNAGLKARCPACATVFIPPAEEESAGPPAAPDPAPPVAPASPPPPARDECPACGAPLAPAAVVCLDCGFNRKLGKQLKTVATRPTRVWHPDGYSYRGRLITFAVFFALLFVPFFFGMGPRTGALVVCLGTLLWALLLGTTFRLTVTKTAQGRPVLITTWWVGFLPITRDTLDLTDYRTIRLTRAGLPGLGYVVGILLLLGPIYGILRLSMATFFALEIAGKYGETGSKVPDPVVLYRGPNEVHLKELGQALEDIAGMRYG